MNDLSVGALAEIEPYVAELVAEDSYNVAGITDVRASVQSLGTDVLVHLYADHADGESLPYDVRVQMSIYAEQVE